MYLIRCPISKHNLFQDLTLIVLMTNLTIKNCKINAHTKIVAVKRGRRVGGKTLNARMRSCNCDKIGFTTASQFYSLPS